MIIRDYIVDIFLIILYINITLFSFLLLRKIIVKLINKRKKKLRDIYEKEILRYIALGDNVGALDKRRFLSKVVIREIILDYSSILKDSKKEELIGLLDRENMVGSIKRKMTSSNKWKKRVGAYEAGEFNIVELTEGLIRLVDEDDRELVYIASLALIKVGGSSYICRVLNRCINEEVIEKKNMLYLIDTIDIGEDIEGILLSLMEKDSVYLKTIALESCGKRQYRGIIEWIIVGLESPYKEIKISALKGALYFRDFPYLDYLQSFIDLKDDPDWEIRLFLAKNLGKLGYKEAIDLLKELMTDENWFVRNSAGLTLLKKGNAGIRALINMLDSSDRFASQKAREILQREIIQENLVENISDRELVRDMMDSLRITFLEENI